MKVIANVNSSKRTAVTLVASGGVAGAAFGLIAGLLMKPANSYAYVVFWAMCICMGVGLALFCMQFMNRAAEQTMEKVLAAARTHLGITSLGFGDLGDELSRAFQEVAESLHQAHKMSSDLKQFAAEVLAATEQQASSSAEQAAAVAQTSATIEELAQTSKQIAENSEAVAAIAERTLESAHEGMQSLEETAAGIEDIRETTRLSSDRILELGERSQEIGRVLVIIDDIAEQTKILALNAAIEAARAGDSGKGFAVVAEEIRKLAESVTRSTQDIGRVVHEIQTSSASLVMATERAQQKVDEGKDLAHRTAEALFRIVNQVGETTTSAKQISMATQQQRSASDQVVVSMREMAQVSSTAAQASRQIQGSVADLTKLADTMLVR